MSAQEIPADKVELTALCQKVRELAQMRDYESCASIIAAAMSKYPHAPQPHNLLGVLLERQGDHLTAMKHFRAAWALDPAYLPARQNLDCFGTFFSRGICAFDESDCPIEPQRQKAVKGKLRALDSFSHLCCMVIKRA